MYRDQPSSTITYLINREQRENTSRERLNETWRLIHNVVSVAKGL